MSPAPDTPTSPPVRLATVISGLGLRRTVLVAFCVIVGLWGLAYYYFTQRIDTLERRRVELGARYERGQDLLTDIRSAALASAVSARNALLDSNPAAAGDYRARVDDAYAEMISALASYVSTADGERALDSPIQRDQVERLRREVEGLRAAVLAALDPHGARAVNDGVTALSARITARREEAMNVAETLLRLNRRGFTAQQADAALLFEEARHDIMVALGLALVASVAVALAVGRRAARLERVVRDERTGDLHHSTDLRRLSARLLASQEDVRRRIARELHDEVGQALTAVKLSLREAQRTLKAAGVNASQLDEPLNVADSALGTVRDLSRLLHPSLLDEMGLCAAIDAHIQGFQRRHHIVVKTEYEDMEARLPPDTELAVYRIVQEALTNAARHSQATACEVRLSRTDESLDVTVTDNGVGFDAVAATRPGATRGLGLLGMRERVSQLGGEMVLDSAPGRGTRVFASLPVRAEIFREEFDPRELTQPKGLEA